MKLLTKEILSKLPALYSTEGIPAQKKIVAVKFFCPWNQWTWYAVEGEREEGDVRFFGYVVGHEKEWGYFMLSELESVRGPMKLKIERDMYFGNPEIGPYL